MITVVDLHFKKTKTCIKHTTKHIFRPYMHKKPSIIYSQGLISTGLPSFFSDPRYRDNRCYIHCRLIKLVKEKYKLHYEGNKVI